MPYIYIYIYIYICVYIYIYMEFRKIVQLNLSANGEIETWV